MEKTEAVQPEAPSVAPHQVWVTLTLLEQKKVLQIMVHICQSVIEQWAKEEHNESKSSHG